MRSMWLFLHRILSRSCTCPAVASAKLSFGIKANGDGTLDIAALASLASHPCTVTLTSDNPQFFRTTFSKTIAISRQSLTRQTSSIPSRLALSRHRFAACGLDRLPLVRPGARMPLSGNSPAEPGKLKNFPVRVLEKYRLFAQNPCRA